MGMNLLKLIKYSKKIKLKKKNSNLNKNPQKKGICMKVLTKSPKKPNSANRRIAKIKVVQTKEHTIIKIQGEQSNLQQHSTILFQGGRSRDLIGIKYKAVRGAYDLIGVLNRKTSRSLYGIKKKKKKKK